MTYKKLIRSLCTAITLLAVPLSTMAQLEEIVVTATKREQTLQDIPIAVSVTSAETLDKAQILDVKDLQSVVPSLRVSQLQNSTQTNFVIRGFGNGANNIGVEPSVGVFIDGVYRSRSGAALSDLGNVQRIEVLHGPQSTLFGKNASAGVISVVTREPTGEFAGKVSATLGNYNQTVLKGHVEGALSDNLAFDLSGSYNQRDGYFENLATGNDLNGRDRYALRGQLVYTPTDSSKFRVIADYDQFDEQCCGVVNLLFSDLSAFQLSSVGGQIVANDAEALSGFNNIDPQNEVENSGLSLHAEFDYNTFSLNSITSYRKYDSFFNSDIDFTSAPVLQNDINTDIETFTQEFRLTSTGDGAIDWMVGAYFFDEAIEGDDTLLYGEDLREFLEAIVVAGGGAANVFAGVEQALGLPVFNTFYVPGDQTSESVTLDNQAISIFGQFDWHINDKLTATLGLNYTKDEKDASVVQTDVDPFSSLDLSLLGLEDLQGLQFFPPFLNYPNAIEDGQSDDDELTYSFRLGYDLNDEIKLYAGVATGFKATSWNLSRDARPFTTDIAAITSAGLLVPNLTSGTRFASPETSTVYEIGLKAKFQRAALNIAIFTQEVEDFQSNVFGGFGFDLSNAELQSTDGIEFDLSWYPTDSWSFKLAGALLDPVYDSFQGALGPSGITDLSGQTVAGVHETSLTLSANYTFTIGNNEAFLRGDYQYDDRIPTNDNILESIASREINLVNLSAGIALESGLRFTLWGRNVTDDATLISGFPSVGQQGSFSGYRTQPRTYGLTAVYEF